MKKAKSPIYFRYEFSDEAGMPEGGDIFKLGSMKELQEMVSEILKVAHSDNVAVNLTIGEQTPFIGFLKKAGMSKEDIAQEQVEENPSIALPSKGSSKKSPKKTSTSKTKKKKKSL